MIHAKAVKSDHLYHTILKFLGESTYENLAPKPAGVFIKLKNWNSKSERKWDFICNIFSVDKIPV